MNTLSATSHRCTAAFPVSRQLASAHPSAKSRFERKNAQKPESDERLFVAIERKVLIAARTDDYIRTAIDHTHRPGR